MQYDVFAPEVPATPRPTIHQLIADAKARGVVGLRCAECGHVHTSLHMIGRPCNFAHPDMDNHDGETCGCWELLEVFGAVKA